MPKIHTKEDGWSDWLAPTHDGYRMACCDCGLVHNMQFKVIKVTERNGDRFSGKEIKGHRVMFRAQRNNRSTAAIRRARRTGGEP